MDLWNSGENQILIDTVIELEKERIERETDNQAFLLWIAQSVGFLHACLHNSGMSGYQQPLKKNPVFEAAPPRVKKILGLDKKETEITDEDIWNGFSLDSPDLC